MDRVSRVILAVAILAAVGLGVSSLADVEPTSCPLPDPEKAAKCAQNILQPWRCGPCLYPTKCYAQAAGWNVNRNCQSNIGSQPPEDIPQE